MGRGKILRFLVASGRRPLVIMQLLGPSLSVLVAPWPCFPMTRWVRLVIGRCSSDGQAQYGTIGLFLGLFACLYLSFGGSPPPPIGLGPFCISLGGGGLVLFVFFVVGVCVGPWGWGEG